jgi:1-deoxy-D-xylulose-5-phosphate reductoisomerase
MNAANEQAVSAFAAGQIPFGEISRLVGLTIDAHTPALEPTLEALLAADRWARESVRKSADKLKNANTACSTSTPS